MRVNSGITTDILMNLTSNSGGFYDSLTIVNPLAERMKALATLVAVVAVLHDPALTALADPRVILLSEGRIVADGSAADVLQPATVSRVFEISPAAALALSGRGGSPN